jgi:DNA repair protein RadC
VATYVETPEVLLAPNGAPAWHVEFDPADDFPDLKSYRVVLLARKRGRRRGVSGQPAEDVYEALRMSALHDREALYLLLLNKKKKVFGVYVWGLGGPTSASAEPASALRVILAAQPEGGVVLVHNHPSGDPWPSPEDVALTDRLIGMLAIFGEQVVDHVVIGRDAFYSFAESGLIARAEGRYESLRAGRGRR